jgi:hypothetical protein
MPKRVYDQAYASFRVWGDDLDPLEITSALKIPPDTQYRRGEPRVRRSRRTGKISEYPPHKLGMWSFSSEPWVRSPRLEAHLSWFLDQLEPHAKTLRGLQRRYKMDFFCFASGSSTRPPTVARSVRSRAEALGVRIEIDYYPSTAATGRSKD